MNAIQAIYLMASILVGVALVAARRPTIRPRSRLVSTGLAILILSLLCVGIVSGTFVRHVIQVIPPVVALWLVAKGSPLGSSAAAPILTFWLGVMLNIWMFLMGIARIFSGTFTSIEIILTITSAFGCALALVGIIRSPDVPSLRRRIVMALTFGIGQFAAMITSFHPAFR